MEMDLKFVDTESDPMCLQLLHILSRTPGKPKDGLDGMVPPRRYVSSDITASQSVAGDAGAFG